MVKEKPLTRAQRMALVIAHVGPLQAWRCDIGTKALLIDGVLHGPQIQPGTVDALIRRGLLRSYRGKWRITDQGHAVIESAGGRWEFYQATIAGQEAARAT